VKEDQQREQKKLEKLWKDKESVQASVFTTNEELQKLSAELEKLKKKLTDQKELKKNYEDSLKAVVEAKRDASSKVDAAREACTELDAARYNLEAHLDSVNATLSELRREVLPRTRLQGSVLSVYGAISLLGQPMAMMSELQAHLGKIFILFY
jgi:chromosome segregation ATPase